MHSPPPTPNTRSNGRATRTKDVILPDKEPSAPSQTISRKRNREQAGLITPRDTPRKKDVNQDGQLNGSLAAKVLFPAPRRKNFRVFQDPRSPDPFNDDDKNPFKAPAQSKKRDSHAKSPEPKNDRDERSSTPERDTDLLPDHPDKERSSRRITRSQKRTPSPRRTDGMTYVFRGKKVFRKYRSAEEAAEAEAIKPKKLFVKEMNAPKLSNPFDEDEQDEEEVGSDEPEQDEDGFDGLELSTLTDSDDTRQYKRAKPASSSARRLF